MGAAGSKAPTPRDMTQRRLCSRACELGQTHAVRMLYAALSSVIWGYPGREQWVSTTTDTPRTFGSLLRHFRRLAGLSQEQLAERAGLSRRGIADLERGARRSPYPNTVHQLADALGLDA